MGDQRRPGFRGGALAPISPYMAIDPSYLNTAPEFILPEGANPNRGRFEMAFSQIGSAVIFGGLAGGVTGLRSGVHERSVQRLTGKVGTTVVWNHITKRGGSTAQTFGVIVLLYSAYGTLIGYGRGAEDQANSLAAGTLTGITYKMPGELGIQCVKRMAFGGAIGFGVSALACTLSYLSVRYDWFSFLSRRR